MAAVRNSVLNSWSHCDKPFHTKILKRSVEIDTITYSVRNTFIHINILKCGNSAKIWGY